MNNAMLINRALSADYSNLGGSFSSERLALAGQMTLLGMVMIFAVLAAIMAVLIIMERVFARKADGKAKKAEPAPAPAPKTPEAPVPVVETVEDDGAVIAAITAAISAILADEGSDSAYQGGFRVVSFKRSNRGTPWNSAR